MEQTWFDLPVESRLTEVWPRGLLKKSKMIPQTCKPADMSVPMPYWNLPVVPMDQKMPLLPGPKDLYHLCRSKLGKKLWACEDSEFSLNEFIKNEIFNAYEILHDPNLAHYLRRPKVVRRLKELGLIDSELGVMCNLRDFNYYRRYLAFVHTNAINKLYRNQFLHGDKALEMTNLCANLERQNAKQRIVEEIDKRHAEVFKEIDAERKKKSAICAKRLRRVLEVYEKKKSDKEARRIAAGEAAKDFTRKVQENLYYANAQLRQHKLDTMRKWRRQNIEKTALFLEREKTKQEDIIKRKTEWFQNKIKHQEKRVLQETQINVLMDHEFSPEYKSYLKYIKRENYKNPPEHSVGPEYRVSSESEIEDTDLLNQLRLFTKAGHQLQRGSFISRAQARQSVAKLANVASRQGSIAHSQVRRMSEKFVREKMTMKGKNKQSVLEALINSDILRLLSPSLQDIFKKSERNWKQPPKQSHHASQHGLNHEMNTAPTLKGSQDSMQTTEAGDVAPGLGLPKDSEIEIKPPNKALPTAPVCHLNVYRYFDRILGKVILEYVTRILLPKFPEIMNRCHWVSKAEGLPEEPAVSVEQPPCHPDDSNESYTQCMEDMKELCDSKMASYMLLLSESPDIRLFRHKYNGIGEITCSESLVGNFMMQSSPHPPKILDYIHWRADWILNYPPPRTYQEIYDLKYVIGVMKKIECPVFQPIYKLWEITNDINLNQEVLDKFILYMEKKKEQKPMVELNPIDIAVKNVRKAMDPLIMDYKAATAIDDYCIRDAYKLPSELFRMTYLKRPVDPKIWKILEDLLDKTKRSPDDLECLRCLPDSFRKKLTQGEEFEELQLTAPECLYVDPRDYAEELRKAKDKAKSQVEAPQRLNFGITEFIPFIEAELFGGKKGVGAESSTAEDEAKPKVDKKKKPSILRASRSSSFKERERRKSSKFKKDSKLIKISPQPKETDLPAKLKGEEKKETETKKQGKKKKGTPSEAGEIAAQSATDTKQTSKENETVDKKEIKDESVVFETGEEGKKKKTADKTADKASDKTSDKKGKGKEGKGKGKEDSKAKGKNKSIEGARSSGKGSVHTDGTSSHEEVPTDKKMSMSKSSESAKDAKIKFREQADVKPVVQIKSAERSRSVSIMKGVDGDPSQQKLDLNVTFKSKMYIEPHLLKSLEVTSELKKAKERAPTPHHSFTSLITVETGKKASIDTSMKKEASMDSSLYRVKPCAPEDSDDGSQKQLQPTALQQTAARLSRRTVIASTRGTYAGSIKLTDVAAPEKLTVEADKETVLNVIQPDQVGGEVEEEEDRWSDHSLASIGSDLEHLRKFVAAKLPYKVLAPVKEQHAETIMDSVPVPPIINKSLLVKRRIIKRPLANILRKIYGWVMTTVIRRRLLISYGLPPKIRKECFYKTKFNSSELDLARGLAKLILEETSEFYPFAVLEPYIETILEQTMDPTKRFDFTKRVIRMDVPLSDEGLESLQEFLSRTEQDTFFKRVRVRRLRKFSMCLKMRMDTIHFYGGLWAGPTFDPQEWEDIFRTPRLEDYFISCTRKKKGDKGKTRRSLIQQQRAAFFAYGGDSPDASSSSSSSSEVIKETVLPTTKKYEVRSSRASNKSMLGSTIRMSTWLKSDNVRKDDPYDEVKPGFIEKPEPSRNKILDIVINKKADLAPSITEINDEMRRDFAHHKSQRKWLEKERQLRFITHLNLFSPILQPKEQNRKLMKFVQSTTYPYFGTFMACQTFTERRLHPPQDVKKKLKSSSTVA